MFSGKSIDHPIMHHSAEHTEVSQNVIDKNWIRQRDAFTGDDLIDAYIQGKKEGQTEYTRVLLSQLKTNLTLAQKVAEDLFKDMNKKGFSITGAYMKAEGITNFNVLVIVSESDFLADNFREVFTSARKIKDASLNDNFHISFTFMPYSTGLNYACIQTDGYFLKYEKAGTVSKPRKA
jgi:hypothetical protein